MLLDCTDFSDSELLIVEGKSAANALKRVVDRRSQAVLALQGKIPNAAKAKSLQKLLENPQIASLIEALGVNFTGEFQADQMRYQRVVILTDPDADGIHLRVLIASLFYLHFRVVLEQQKLFTIYAPLYSLHSSHLETPAIAYNHSQYIEALADLQAQGVSDAVTTRYKGLAGMDQSILNQCCVDKESRMIKLVTMSDCNAMLRAFGG